MLLQKGDATMKTKFIVPEGYAFMSERNDLYISEGNMIPSYYKLFEGDKLYSDEYIYTFDKDHGWKVETADKERTEYSPIFSEIDKRPIFDMDETFMDCTNMVKSPKIPESVTGMNKTFMNCVGLKEAPVLPSRLMEMRKCFYGCISLEKQPVIPESVLDGDAKDAFAGCPFHTDYQIPEGCVYKLGSFSMTIESGEYLPENYKPRKGDTLTSNDYTYTFLGNEANGWSVKVNDPTEVMYEPILAEIAGKPIVDVKRTFAECKNLAVVPELPDTVEDKDIVIGKSAADEVLDDDDYSFDSGEASYSVPDRDDEER